MIRILEANYSRYTYVNGTLMYKKIFLDALAGIKNNIHYNKIEKNFPANNFDEKIYLKVKHEEPIRNI